MLIDPQAMETMTRDIIAPDGRVLLTLTVEQVAALGLNAGVPYIQAVVGQFAYIAQIGFGLGDPVWLLRMASVMHPIVPGDVVKLRGPSGQMVTVGEVKP